MSGDSEVTSGASLSELWQCFWSRRWLFVVIVAVSTAMAITYALVSQEWFRASVVMVSASRSEASGRLGQLGGLATLAGVNLGGSNNSEPLAVLRSKILAREFIIEQDLLSTLLSASPETDKQLDLREAVLLFDQNVRSVSEDKKAGTITLTIEWKDSSVAANWANEYVRSVNKRLQEQALSEAQRNVEFLRREIAGTDVVQLRQSLGTVLETEMQKLMLARGNESFAFRVVDDATPPLERSRPNRVFIVLLGTLFGVFVATVVVFWRLIFAIRG